MSRRDNAQSSSDSSNRPLSRRATGAFLASYLVILLALFHSLLWGEVFCPAAALQRSPPFLTYERFDSARYVNGTQYDVWRAMECFQEYQYRAAQEGRFPTWNPHIFCGLPFHANGQSAMLSPFHWAYFWIDPIHVRGPLAILRLWIAASALFLLCRRIGLRPLSCFVAGLVWMLCAYNVRWLLWTMTNTTTWLSLLLLAMDLLVCRPTMPRLVLAALAAAVLQLGGHPETQFLTGLFAGLWVVVRAASLPISPIEGAVRVGAGLLAMILGTLIAAAALLPFVLVMLESASWSDAIHRSPSLLPASASILFLAPEYHGRTLGELAYSGPVNYNEAGVYFGSIPFVLACAAFVAYCLGLSRRQYPGLDVLYRYSFLLTAMGVVFAFDVPFVTSMARAVPVLGHTNLLRMVIAIQLAGALLAALGIEWVLDGNSRFRYLAAGLAGLSAAVLGMVISRSLLPALKEALADPFLVESWHNSGVRTAGALCFVLAGGLALVWTLSAVRRATVLAVLVTLELFWTAQGLNPIGPLSMARPQLPANVAQALDGAKGQRACGIDEFLVPNLAMRFGFNDVRGYDFPLPRRIPALFERLGIDYQWTVIPSGLVFPSIRPELAAFLERTSTVAILSYVRQDSIKVRQSPGRVVPVWTATKAIEMLHRTYYFPGTLPRAYFAQRVAVRDSRSALDRLVDIRFDLREESIVEDPRALDDVPPDATGRTAITIDLPERVVIETESPTGGLVVLADRMDAGWNVTIDGQPATGLIANYFFRGVVVPPGSHVVEWTYTCPGLAEGIAISLTTLCCLLVLALASLWRRPRPASLAETAK